MWRFTICFLLAATVLGCRGRGTGGVEPISVQTAKLRREPISFETRFSATVREQQRIELSFKVPGTVSELLELKEPDGRLREMHEGDVVTADVKHPLARLDDSDYRRKMAAAQDRLAAVQAKERATAATVVGVRATFDRVKALRERGSVAQQMYDDTLAKRDAAVAELDAVRREISAANVAYQQAEDDWKHCSLVPPIPRAVISRKFVEKGERVQAGQPVFEIMDLSRVRVAFGVPDTRVGTFELGQTVPVSADAFPGERFVGRVTKIAPAADLRTRTFEIEVSIDQPKSLKPGMVVAIVIGKREEMVLVPMTAVQRGEKPGDLTVYAVVDEGGKKVARLKRAKLDGVYDNKIRLIEGDGSELAVGDVVVVGGAFRLSDGQVVREFEAR